MNKQELKVGVVGADFIGSERIEALRQLGIEVSAIADSSPELASAKAEELRLGKVYESFEALIADPQINVVHIASPNHLRYPQAKAALEAGKHVVCENPLAIHPRQSAELVALAKERNLIGAVNFNLRFCPMVQRARAMALGGEIGDVFIVRGSCLQNWRLEPEPGGQTPAIAHWLDLITFITGLRIKAVSADFAAFRPDENPEITTEDYATVMLRFGTMERRTDPRGVVTISEVSAGRKNRLSFEIDGSRSSLSWDSERPDELLIGHRHGPNELLKDTSSPSIETFPDTFKQLYHAIFRNLQASDFAVAPDFPTFQDGHYELALGEAIFVSARTGQWVNVGVQGQ